jgi:hypothetical protein
MIWRRVPAFYPERSPGEPAAQHPSATTIAGRRCCSTAIRDDNVGPASLREQQLRDDVASKNAGQQQLRDDVADQLKTSLSQEVVVHEPDTG